MNAPIDILRDAVREAEEHGLPLITISRAAGRELLNQLAPVPASVTIAPTEGD